MSAARAIPQDRPSGVQLRLAGLARGQRPGSRRVTNVERVLAAVASGCSTETADLMAATGLSREQVCTARHHALGSLMPGRRAPVAEAAAEVVLAPPAPKREAARRRRRVFDREPRVLPVVQSYFEAGFGERRDCTRYEECLAGWSGFGVVAGSGEDWPDLVSSGGRIEPRAGSAPAGGAAKGTARPQVGPLLVRESRQASPGDGATADPATSQEWPDPATTGFGHARGPRGCKHHETPDRTLESMHRACSRPGAGGLP